ncbi:MAG: hypothetical protein AB2L22_13215 [Syntrophales bacterium]
MNYKQKAVYGNYIPEDELPMRAGIKVLRTSDPDYGLSEDEVADRNEFIRCHLAREFELLMMVPAKTEESDFFIIDLHVADDGYSAYNTVDFQRTQKPFDKYAYAMKKVMERLKDIAVLHSSISNEEGKRNTSRRFQSMVAYEFREPLFGYVDRYKAARTDEQRQRLKQKIGELNRRILECGNLWERFALCNF